MDITKMEVIVTDKPEDIKMSMAGRNSYCLTCEATERSASYAVCLHTQLAMDENRLTPGSFTECQRARTHNHCVAIDMRKAEEKAGHALYFRERIQFQISKGKGRSEKEMLESDATQNNKKVDKTSESYLRGRYGHSPVTKVKPKTKKKAKSVAKEPDLPVQMDHAAEVTKAAAKLKRKTKKPTKPAKKGESIVDMIRRRREAQAKE